MIATLVSQIHQYNMHTYQYIGGRACWIRRVRAEAALWLHAITQPPHVTTIDFVRYHIGTNVTGEYVDPHCVGLYIGVRMR
jgi:hypothetical protein